MMVYLLWMPVCVFAGTAAYPPRLRAADALQLLPTDGWLPNTTAAQHQPAPLPSHQHTHAEALSAPAHLCQGSTDLI